MKATNAIILSIALGCAASAFAADNVRSGGREDKPGRALDESDKTEYSPTSRLRGIEGEAVKSGGRENKPGRAVEDNTVKSGGREDKPGRTVAN